MHIVAGIKLPKSADASDLYIQCNEAASINYQEDDKQVLLRQGDTLSTNSYFNSFYEFFYTKYTTLNNIYYLLQLEGDFEVTVRREFNENTKKEIVCQAKFENCQFS
ncbi:MAG TPA: glycosyl transferase family 2, partial [Cyanobacteria bacterium UBA11372]|nr:glycosyl transferase family 2 [Cyanobacteria bacterium UBA11372]